MISRRDRILNHPVRGKCLRTSIKCRKGSGDPSNLEWTISIIPQNAWRKRSLDTVISNEQRTEEEGQTPTVRRAFSSNGCKFIRPGTWPPSPQSSCCLLKYDCCLAATGPPHSVFNTRSRSLRLLLLRHWTIVLPGGRGYILFLVDFPSTKASICGLFVSVHDGRVSLIHQTARELRNAELPELRSGKW